MEPRSKIHAQFMVPIHVTQENPNAIKFYGVKLWQSRRDLVGSVLAY